MGQFASKSVDDELENRHRSRRRHPAGASVDIKGYDSYLGPAIERGNLPRLRRNRKFAKAKESTVDKDEQNIRRIYAEICDGQEFNRDSLTKAFEELKIRLGPSQLDEMMQYIDSNGDGKISFEEFREYALKRQTEIQYWFNRLDMNHDKQITMEEMFVAIDFMGMKATRNQVETFFDKIDADKNGSLSYEEFSDFLLKLPCVNPAAVFESFSRHALDIGFMHGVGADLSPGDQATVGRDGILAASLISGIISRTVVAPLDRIRTLIAAGTKINGMRVHNVSEGYRAIWNQGGFQAFYRGNGLNVLKLFPEAFCRLLVYEGVKHLWCEDPQHISAGDRFVAGSLGGGLSQLLVYPADILKARLTVSCKQLSFTELIHQTASQGGWRAFYRGLTPALCSVVPYSGVDMAVFNGLREKWCEMNPYREPGIPDLLGMAVCSTVSGQLAAYPLYIVSVSMQTQGMDGATVRYRGVTDCARQIFAEGGVQGFYRGIGPNLIRALPSSCISWLVFDNMRRAVRDYSFKPQIKLSPWASSTVGQ